MRNIWSYLKIFLALVLLVFLALDLKGDPLSDASLEDVTQAVVEAAGLQEKEPAANRLIRRFYGLNPHDYAGIVLYAPSDNMDVHELLIVKLADLSQSEAVEEAIEARLDTQLKSFEGYGPEQVALLNAHRLNVEGNFIFFMVGETAPQGQAAFLSHL